MNPFPKQINPLYQGEVSFTIYKSYGYTFGRDTTGDQIFYFLDSPKNPNLFQLLKYHSTLDKEQLSDSQILRILLVLNSVIKGHKKGQDADSTLHCLDYEITNSFEFYHKLKDGHL